jgi:hypothetical protein
MKFVRHHSRQAEYPFSGYTFQFCNLWSTDMTVNAQSRPQAFDISNFFAPEIVNPTKQIKTAMVFEASPQRDHEDFNYALSKYLDHPVQCHFERLWLTQAFPRGIPWHNFPVVSDPFYRIRLGDGSRPIGFTVHGVKDPSSESLLSSADVLVFRENADRRHAAIAAYNLAYILRKFGLAGVQVIVDSHDGQLASATVSELEKAMSAEWRFCYSYLVNFRAIAMKALREVGGDIPADQWDSKAYGLAHFSNYSGIRPMLSEPLNHPLALQWLYRLRSIGLFDVSYIGACEEFRALLVASHGEFEIVCPTALPFDVPANLADVAVFLKHHDGKYTLAFDGDSGKDPRLSQLRHILRRKGLDFSPFETTRRVVSQLIHRWDDDSTRLFALDHEHPTIWKGTGKYPAVAVPKEVATTPLSFIAMNLVSYDERKRTISLSDKGHRFLDLLHPDCEDPDVILRWMGEDGLFLEGVSKSCDDWIMRFFSKMKTRINDIGS